MTGATAADFSMFTIHDPAGSMCGRCGGLIAQPGKTYGWAGKWCHCPVLDTDSIIRRAAEARDAEDKRRFAQEQEKQRSTIRDWLGEQPKRPPQPELTAHDFVVWMRGFFAGRMASPVDPQLEALLRETLARVRS